MCRSSDGAQTIHDDSPAARELLAQLGAFLGLKPHLVRAAPHRAQQQQQQPQQHQQHQQQQHQPYREHRHARQAAEAAPAAG